MNVTEAKYVNVLVQYCLGISVNPYGPPIEIEGAVEAAAYLAGRANERLGAGVTLEQVLAFAGAGEFVRR